MTTAQPGQEQRMEKPACDICGQPYHRHNLSTGLAMCPIIPSYRTRPTADLGEDGELVTRLSELQALLASDEQSNRYYARLELAGMLPRIIDALLSRSGDD